MLSEREQRLVRLFAAVVLGRWEDVRALRAEAPAGEPDRAWREALLQAHVFAGFPRLVEAYGVLAGAGGLGELEPGEVAGSADEPQRGRELFDRIYRERADDVRAHLHAAHPDFGAWIEGYAYGRVLSRPGLAADRRELLAVAALAVLGQERQLASHVRGALRVGAAREEVVQVLELVADWVPGEKLERVRELVERFA